MHLEIRHTESEGVTIVSLKGRVVLGPEDLALRQWLQSLQDGGRKNVIVNLGAVTDIDSAGVGTLVVCAEKFQKAGGKLVLLNVVPTHTKLTSALQLDIAFETYSAEQDAINSFFPDRAVRRYDILEFVEERELSPKPEGAPGKKNP